jgi:hypothetical protein
MQVLDTGDLLVAGKYMVLGLENLPDKLHVYCEVV